MLTQFEGAKFQDSYALGINPYAINLGCATRLADLGHLYVGLSGCTTGLIDPGQLHIGLPGCTTELTHYISGSVQLCTCNRASSSSPIIHPRCPVVQRDKLILIGCTSGLVQLHIR